MKAAIPDQRSVTIGDKSLEALWAGIARETVEAEPPPGSMSARQFAEKFKFPLNAARQKLAKLVDSGRMTAAPYRVKIRGQRHETLFYTPVAPKPD
jgi:hypothetical protein